MRQKILNIAFVIFVSSLPIVGQSEVARIRGDAGRSGDFSGQSIDSFNTILWKTRVFSVEDDDRHYRRITVLGRAFPWFYPSFVETDPLFHTRYDLSQGPASLIHNGTIYFTRNFDIHDEIYGYLIALDLKSGKVLWSHSCDECVLSNPLGYKSGVILTQHFTKKDRKGAVMSLNGVTGQPEWIYELNQLSAMEPAIDDNDVLYFATGYPDPQFGKATLFAFDIATQKIKWSFEAKGAFSTPAISSGTIFLGSNRDFLYALDPTTGKEKWRFKAEAHAPVVRDGSVYFNDYSNLYAVDTETGVLKWKQKDSGGISSFFAVSKSSIFFGGDRNFRSVDRTTGKVNWWITTKGDAYEPVIVNDRILAGGTREFLTLDSVTGRKLATIQSAPDSVSSPAVVGDTVIVSNGDGYFFAIKK